MKLSKVFRRKEKGGQDVEYRYTLSDEDAQKLLKALYDYDRWVSPLLGNYATDRLLDSSEYLRGVADNTADGTRLRQIAYVLEQLRNLFGAVQVERVTDE